VDKADRLFQPKDFDKVFSMDKIQTIKTPIVFDRKEKNVRGEVEGVVNKWVLF